MPPVTMYRTILLPHPTLKGKTTTQRIVEDFCHPCSIKTYTYNTNEEELDLGDLGLSIPERSNYDY